MAKYGFFIGCKKRIVSSALVVAAGVTMAGGTVYADKAEETRAVERETVAAAAEAKEQMLRASVFVPVVEVEGLDTLDACDFIPGIDSMNDATLFNESINTAIEAKKAEEEAKAKAEAEAKAKAEAEAKAKAEAERKAAEERARQEAAANAQSPSSESQPSTDTSLSDDTSAAESGDNSADESAPASSRDVSVLYKYVGCPYVYGGTSPSGWDCSGFVQYVMKHEFGVSVSRTASGQSGNGSKVSVSDRSQWQPGDLLIYKTSSGNIGHVGIYLGGGQMIHALNAKHNTLVQSVSQYEGWDSNTLVGVRRVLK